MSSGLDTIGRGEERLVRVGENEAFRTDGGRIKNTVRYGKGE
jgi:hypothetical protein